MLPGRASIYSRTVSGLELTNSASREVERLLAVGEREPVAYELLREARATVSGFSRAAVVIAVAALEVGIKDFVSIQVPEAARIVEEIPAPPTPRILEEYLPTLDAVKALAVEQRAVPQGLIDTVKKAVHLRNRIVHAGAEPGDMESTSDVMDAVEDVLHLLDVYSGHEWAASLLSDEARAVLRS